MEKTLKMHKVGFIGGRGFFSNYGGVENATREISLEMSKQGIIPLIYGIETTAVPASSQTGVQLQNCPKCIYDFFGQYGLILFSVLHTIFISRPKVVFLFASGPCIFTPILRIGGIKVITSLRAIDSARDKWGLISRSILKAGEYCAWRFANVFTVNSKEMVLFFKEKRADVNFIPNGSTLDAYSTEEIPLQFQNKKYFLFAARFDPVKRLHLLLEAYSKLDETNLPMLVIAGGNSKNKEYELQLRKYESDNIVFLGHISQQELSPLMAQCTAFILPSVLEGMSNSLLSAMVNGKPILAADIPANADLLENKDAIFKADDINALKIGLQRLATDNDFCNKLGTDLQNRALQCFTWKTTTDKFLQAASPFMVHKD